MEAHACKQQGYLEVKWLMVEHRELGKGPRALGGYLSTYLPRKVSMPKVGLFQVWLQLECVTDA